jgi:probable rRNA maturation factor
MRTPQRVRAATAPTIEIIVESTMWKKERGAKTAVRQAIAAAAGAVPERTGELAIVLTDDAAIRALNRTWRGKNEATNVLSFPAQSPPGTPALLGDIVIAYETTAREAQAEGKPFRHHLAHLAVHGYLHLAGHDHKADAEAEAMESLEIAVLARLKVPNPYIARDAKG